MFRNGLRSGPLRLVLLFALLAQGCALTGSSPVANQPASRTSQKATHANQQIGEKERRDGRFIGLALSGGGSRSAVFATAVMLELQRAGILEQVDFISSVSGGAIPAALYALDGYRGFRFQDQALARVSQDFQGEWITRWLLPSNWFRYWLTSYTRSDTLVEVLEDFLYQQATYADLNPNRPKPLLNATNATAGTSFVIAEEQFRALNSSLQPLHVARAVYMSSAYPGILSPVTLGRYGTSTSEREPDFRFAIYDGGPIDNLGISTLLDVLRIGEETGGSLESVFPRGCLVISVDATPRTRNGNSQELSASHVLLLSNRREVLERIGIPNARQDETMFGAFSLVGGRASCHAWHLALRQLPDDDSLGRHVTRIRTSLTIEPNDKTALIAAAARLVQDGMKQGRVLPGLAGLLDEGMPAQAQTSSPVASGH